MVREIAPERSRRAASFALWNQAPMPMVTLMKTLDVTRLVQFSRRRGYKFNMLLCWCVGQAAARMEDFYLLPVGDRLMEYDRLAVNTVVVTRDGDIQTCDLPLSSDLEQFSQNYLELTGQVSRTGQPHDLSGEAMVIGTSALAGYDIDGAVNLYAGCYNNPFLIWGRYRRHWLRTLLPVSFQFHHAQLDGVPAAQFLEYLQEEIRSLGT
ncbi:MAG: CatA-like O-acetyltransferase, family 2 [Lawsonibacter sp.]|jgi:chloramphenicol O-acetyltransferase type A